MNTDSTYQVSSSSVDSITYHVEQVRSHSMFACSLTYVVVCWWFRVFVVFVRYAFRVERRRPVHQDSSDVVYFRGSCHKGGSFWCTSDVDDACAGVRYGEAWRFFDFYLLTVRVVVGVTHCKNFGDGVWWIEKERRDGRRGARWRRCGDDVTK